MPNTHEKTIEILRKHKDRFKCRKCFDGKGWIHNSVDPDDLTPCDCIEGFDRLVYEMVNKLLNICENHINTSILHGIARSIKKELLTQLEKKE